MAGGLGMSKSVLRKIQGVYPQLSAVETKIADYVLAHPSEVIQQSIEELARECDASEASIIRFCQRLGYSGIKELKIVLAQEVGSLVPAMLTQSRTGEAEGDYLRQVLEQSVEGMRRTVNRVDPTMLDATVRAIGSARIVDIYGAGESYVVGEALQIKLRRLGIIANIFQNPHLQAISSASLQPGDVAVGISFSGCTQDTIDALEFAAKRGATTIAITNFPDFPLAEKADVVLETDAVETVLPAGSISSRLAQHMIVDLIFTGLLVTFGDKYRKAYEFYNAIITKKM
jgi:DNA-binding MurR/RpiR family transcriptional regulator